jgi:sialic acid synthase SpsE
LKKHFTLRRSDGGVDAAFSLEPEELKNLVIECNRAYQALGKINYEILEAEKKSIQFKRSIYVVKDINAGDTFSADNIRIIRPVVECIHDFTNRFLEKKLLIL